MIIGFTGYKRSGKDTAGQALVENLGFTKTAPLAVFKEALGQWFDFSEDQMDGPLKETVDPRWGISPRELFQLFGSELMKQDLGKRCPRYAEVTGNYLWARSFYYRTKRLLDANPKAKLVVCDIRFPEEVSYFRSLPDSHLFRIDRPGTEGVTDKHISERYIESLLVDEVILNTGTVQQLQDYVVRLVRHEGGLYGI